ncbi:MAG: TonB-dependent receptor domain-containing protein, partial [bacterium]
DSPLRPFLENTPFGTATEKDGRYTIHDISPGVHQLIVRMMGYKEIREYVYREGETIVQRDFSLKREAYKVEAVEVLAEREKVVLKKAVSRFSLKPRTISVIPSYGEADIFRTIQSLPGVVMTSEFKSQLYIRGGNSDQNLILLDGAIVYNPFHFSGILSSFDVDAIDEVDFSSGGFQAEYGGRLSSVLDIKTRKGAAKIGGRLNLSPISAKLMIEGPMGSWGNYLFTGRRSYVSTTAKKIGGSVEPDFYDGIGRVEVRPTWKDRIILSGFYGRDSVRVQNENKTKQITSENKSAAFNYHRTFSEKFNTSLRGTYGEFKTARPQGLDRFERQKNHVQDKSADFKMELTLHDGLSFKAGANYHEIRIRYKSADPIIPEINIDERLFETAFFLQSHIKVKEKWTFDTGIRMNRYDKGMPYILEPRVSLLYDINRSWSLKGAYGRFSQNLVTIFNENDNFNPVEIWLPPDPDLPIARADHVIVGSFYSRPDMIFSTEVYWKKFHHLTHYNRERLYPGDPFFVQGKGYSLGLDVSLQLIKERWQLWMSYSLAKAIKELPFQYPEPSIDRFAPRYDRRHNLNLAYEYQLSKKLIGSIRFNIGSGLPFSFLIGGYDRWSTWVIDQTADYTTHPPNEPTYYLTAINSARDEFRFPVYHRLDVSLRFSHRIGAFTFKPCVQILNLYNQPNVLFYDLQGKPHKSLPILPMLALEIQL